MLIGEDYDKIEWSFSGLDLLEPNAFYGDTLLFFIAIYFSYKTAKFNLKSSFFYNWRWFFLVFGVGFFCGGLGHLFYNYTGVYGKYPSWYGGIVSMYFLELAMISIYPKELFRKTLRLAAVLKLIVSVLSATIMYSLLDLSQDPSPGLIIPSINTFIGLVLALGVLGRYYSKTYSADFKYLIISVFVMVPAAIAQALKLNPHQWFDRNDISHVALAITLYLYYKGVKGYNDYLSNNR